MGRAAAVRVVVAVLALGHLAAAASGDEIQRLAWLEGHWAGEKDGVSMEPEDLPERILVSVLRPFDQASHSIERSDVADRLLDIGPGARNVRGVVNFHREQGRSLGI